LIGLQKRTANDASRFLIVADKSTRIRLFSTTLLDRILPLTSKCPAFDGELLPLETHDLDARQLGEHVMQSHRQLASVPCKQSATFQAIADRLAKELGEG
jgi:hypothetical protein